jgi:hypothetical protein
MRADAFAIRLRRRGKLEAVDLGVRLCQSAAPSVFRCYLAVAVPFILLSLASFEIATWLPSVVIWCGKPWLDRTVLFALSRAAFGEQTRPRDLWQAQRSVLWRQLFITWTLRRLSPWRSFTQPVYQLEGLSIWKMRKRILQIRSGNTGTGFTITAAFSMIEAALTLALLSLALYFVPGDAQIDWMRLLSEDNMAVAFASAAAYGIVVAFLEPFYVAAGFALYLNRRVELEAWDVEQELRRAFER